MADLNGRDRDRGQLILVAGFTLAVTFLALAIVANSAIFAENLATRDDTTGSTDALLARDEAEGNVANVIVYLNENNVSDLPGKAERSIEENMSVQGGIQNARQGRVVAVEYVTGSARVEARLFQENNSRSFTNASGEANWTLASDANKIQKAEFNISTSDLADVTKENRTDGFTFVINDSSEQWNMSVYESDGPGDANVSIDIPGGSPGAEKTVSVNGAFVIINLSSETIDGSADTPETVSELSDYSSLGANTTRFKNGDKVAGNYSIKLENPEGIQARDYNESASPVADVQIERLKVTFTYETASLRYETTFEVTPNDV